MFLSRQMGGAGIREYQGAKVRTPTFAVDESRITKSCNYLYHFQNMCRENQQRQDDL